MLSKALKVRVVFALVFAMLVAWAGHTSALMASPGQVISLAEKHGHSHNDEDRYGCHACSDHQHAPFTPDHVHETPDLATDLKLAPSLEQNPPTASLLDGAPSAHIFLIERPPRSTLML